MKVYYALLYSMLLCAGCDAPSGAVAISAVTAATSVVAIASPVPSPSPSPTPFDYTGTWSGWADWSNSPPTSSAVAYIAQTGSAVTGTWHDTQGHSGTLSWTVTGGGLTNVVFSTSTFDCHSVDWTRSQSDLNGTFGDTNCQLYLTLTRQ